MRLLLASILLLLPAACGYTQTDEGGTTTTINGYHWSSLYRQDIKTVAVPIFTNRDYHCGVEFQLSEALVKKIEEFTPYKVTSRDHADTILEGEIIAITPKTLNLDPNTATPQEVLYTIIINFTWKDIRTGKVLVSKHNFTQSTTYYPTLGESDFVGSQDSSEKLALAVVHEMEAAW
jgi:hypothetical protein